MWRSAARSDPDLPAVLRRLGDRVRALRHEREMTQETLAAHAQVDAKHLQAIEAGRVNATVATLISLARGLGVNLDELCRGV